MSVGIIRNPGSMQDVLNAVENGTVEQISGDLTLEPGGGLVPLDDPALEKLPKPEMKDEYKVVTLTSGSPEFIEFKELLKQEYAKEIEAITPLGKQIFPMDIVAIKITQEFVEHVITEEDIENEARIMEGFGEPEEEDEETNEIRQTVSSMIQASHDNTWDVKKTPLKFRCQFVIKNQGLIKKTVECNV